MLRLFALVFALATASAHAAGPFKVGDILPADIKATDQNGKTHTLGEARGHPLVLEWINYGCPFSRKHYDSGNMQNLQAKYTAKGVVWFSVISSAPGKQGYLSPAEAPAAVAKEGFKGTAVLLDPTGTLGRQFGATTTPDMVVIDAQGKVIYMGAIDDIPSFSIDDIARADNYVADALDATLADQPVKVAETKPYGCSVKY
jgi:hypothetical protein